MDGKTIAEKLVEESIVLLKNEAHLLPFGEGQKAAFFGRCQIDTIYSGNGSGAAHGGKAASILEECGKAGIDVEPGIKAFYQKKLREEARDEKDDFDWSKMGTTVNSGIMYEIFGRYHAPVKEYEIPKELIGAARGFTDTAVVIIGRNSGGEECDRHLQADYYLTDSEKALLDSVCGAFSKVVVILNINGLIDLAWTERYESIKSILFIGVPGEEGAKALAKILVGGVNPSGKLSVTIARRYEDYPASAHFSWDKEHPDNILTYESYGLDAEKNGSTGYEKSPITVYWEDIYAGYRYFDTFAREPLFAFGYGLSYSEFAVDVTGAVKETDGIRVKAKIKNTGYTAGKETLQCYLLARGAKNARAYQELKGFEKTRLLAAGEEQELAVFVPWKEFACYDEETAAYVIEKGTYELRAGSCSRNTKPAVIVRVEEDILAKQCENRLGIRACNRDKLSFLSRTDRRTADAEDGSIPWIGLRREDVNAAKSRGKRRIVPDSQDTPESKARELSLEQLAALCVGYGPGIPFAAFRDGRDPATILDGEGKPLTVNSHPTGVCGYVSPAIKERGIESVFYKDGPAGTGEIAWPAEMLIACAFNKEIWYAFGDAVGGECGRQKIDIWLAPAVNLHRHPLGGRNFEYFSEDPFLTGSCACEIAKGVQENHPVLVCPKHFAVNEQETYRRGSAKKNIDAADSIIRERAARELYLKPFEMLVREAHVSCIMTSFNKINGVFAGGNKELCTYILREEWGFEGAVVTDWGDMDVVVDGADAVAAGNDIVMPGGPPVIAQILKGYREGRVTRKNMETAVAHLLEMIEMIKQRNGGKNYDR